VRRTWAAVSARLQRRRDEVGSSSYQGQGPVQVCSFEEQSGRRYHGKPGSECVLKDISMGDSSRKKEQSDDETGSTRPQERVYVLLLRRRTQRGDDEEQRAEANQPRGGQQIADQHFVTADARAAPWQ
jgi:hypothetical protein